MLLCQKDPCQVFPHVADCLMLYDSFSFLFLKKKSFRCLEHLAFADYSAAVAGLKTAVWGTGEFSAHLPLCLTECGCRTLVRETKGSLTGGEKNKKPHLDLAERKD